MITIRNLPLSVINRALELYGCERELTPSSAWNALEKAQGTKDTEHDFPGIAPLPQALAEYMSLSGPWQEDSGEYAGESGYQIYAE